MRVYLPLTLTALAGALIDGEVGPAPLVAHAVTPALREWYVEGDLEELEYAAMEDAAQASLRLLSADPVAPRRRLVLAADVDDPDARPAPDLARSAVTVRVPVPLARVVSAHVDDHDADADVRAAVEALAAADAGDPDAQFTVDSAAGHELMWFAAQELPDLVRR